MADTAALKAKVKKLTSELAAARKEKDKVLAAATQKVSKLRAELDEATETLGETDG